MYFPSRFLNSIFFIYVYLQFCFCFCFCFFVTFITRAPLVLKGHPDERKFYFIKYFTNCVHKLVLTDESGWRWILPKMHLAFKNAQVRLQCTQSEGNANIIPIPCKCYATHKTMMWMIYRGVSLKKESAGTDQFFLREILRTSSI